MTTSSTTFTASSFTDWIASISSLLQGSTRASKTSCARVTTEGSPFFSAVSAVVQRVENSEQVCEYVCCLAMIRSITFRMALAPERTSSILVEILVAVSFFCSNSSICFVVSSINATVSEASASKLTAGVEATIINIFVSIYILHEILRNRMIHIYHILPCVAVAMIWLS